MPPNSETSEEFLPKSTLGIKPPPNRHRPHTVRTWLEDKAVIDNAEGLWRVHDGIYDLTDFVKKHPGGSEWIELTKGLDITEAFEVHHLSHAPEEVLKKYFVRKASKKRNCPFTFKDDGFYRTLKREVQKVLPNFPQQARNTTNFLIDSILVAMFLVSIEAVRYNSWLLATLAGFCMGCLTIAAHNYLHHKDNFRMYYFNFSLMQVTEWRISHVISHHLHTNTIDDFEISAWEPLVQYMPVKKTKLKLWVQALLSPLYWATGFHRAFIARVSEHLKGRKVFWKTDLVALALPLAMYIFGGGQSLITVLLFWTYIVFVGSFHLYFVGQNAAHQHPDTFHDGDTPRSTEDYDWGVSQLDALMERKDITGSHFLVLTNFGDHCLHHLFPTLDHGTLVFLYPTFQKVMEQFDVNLMMVTQFDTIVGQWQQLFKQEPNKQPPNLYKYGKLNLDNWRSK